MTLQQEFLALVPEQHLNLLDIPRGPAKTAALEAAYDDDFIGCYLPDMDGPAGRAARYFEDEFKDVAGKDAYQFEMLSFFPTAFDRDADEGHIASKPAFRQWSMGRDPQAVDWLFGIFQNYGDCVCASLTELLQGILGIRAEVASSNERFRWLMGFYSYAFRGSCGHGWYIPTAASVTLQHGYCFALPDVAGFKYLEENDSENLVAKTWCRGGPPASVRDFVNSKGWRFDQHAVTKFSGGMEALKDVFRLKGQVHHGSNTTSGSSTPGRLKRIGGHAQTAFGGDWSERTLQFFRDQGITIFSAENFPVAHHQTWGGSWSGAVADRYWPEWWGPKPQGAWITTAKQALESLFRSAYVYLPYMQGWPSDGPPAPPTGKVELTGRLQADNGSPIRGVLTAKAGDDATEYIIVPDGSGGYVPTQLIR